MEDFRKQLRRVLELVRSCESPAIIDPLQEATVGPDEALLAYLQSNELWGGAGSIADEAGLIAKDENTRRSIEKRLIELGDMQTTAGIVNPRTSMWTEAFRKQHRRGT